MYSEQIEKLIELALADGELTEKEKQVLFKRAETEGIDLDEFEMVLEARIYGKIKSKPNAAVAPKSDKLGDVKKCPSCGAIAESFTIKCSDCGTEFRNIEASNSVIKFFDKLDEVEATRATNVYELSQKKSIGIGTILLWLCFWHVIIFIKLIQFLIYKSKSAKWSTTDSRKEELIMNYPVPVSKEAILEFLTLSSSKLHSSTYFNLFSEDTKYRNAWNKIWLKKIEQINSKAIIAMKGDSASLKEVENLVKNAKGIAKDNTKKIFQVLAILTLIILTFIIWTIISTKIDDNRNNIYTSIVTSAEKLIEDKKYDEAENLLKEVDSKHKVEIKSKIQLSKMSEKLDNLEPLLNRKEYSKLKMELEKLMWTKITPKSDWDLESIEKESFKNFIRKKEALNNQMPEDKRAKIESEYSL
ncbi:MULTISPECIES: hypothetical protein [Sphingobacterium]|uniref:hypothetical protein n=1 Tax=Sphingobacterium TaxID=28453 RepID=UPI00104AD5CD|nr:MULTISPECIES: hypothetical protein [Sphingobacterium]MCW2260126.1 putative amidophosphoribosyltransferase [Sphingobacterium kitahiroshimense]TCR11083.1 hypothetical protein EDF67_104176 [Sphingobacterium sp. JUb78]